MNPLVILVLIGAGLHLATPAELPSDVPQGRYAKPVVFTNLPPPVLYFPNFPEEKVKASERGDTEDKRVEYVPFPFKELPLLVYQSDNQPPVHVVQQHSAVVQTHSAENHKETTSERQASPQPSGSEGKFSSQQSGYGQQYQNSQALQDNQEDEFYGTFPNLRNHQFISIGLSAINDILENVGFPNTPLSQLQGSTNDQAHRGQNGQKNSQQHVLNVVQPPQSQQYFVRNNGEQLKTSKPNIVSQYSQGAPMKHQSSSQEPIQNSGPKMQQEHQGYMNHNQAQNQYSQSNQQQNIAYQQQNQEHQGHTIQVKNQYSQNNQQQNIAYQQQNQNIPQTSYTMRQVVYQQPGNANLNYQLQPSGTDHSTSYTNQQQVGNKITEQNFYYQNQQSQPVEEDDSEEDDAQYIKIAVYPHDATNPNQVQEPHSYYKIAIPQPNEDEAYQQNGGHINSVRTNNGESQQVNSQNQESRYIGLSLGGHDSQQQNPRNVINAVHVNQQHRNKALHKHPQQNSPENQNEDDTEYQQILIHIPHSIAPAPQILVQPENNGQSSTSYVDATQERKKPPSSPNKSKPKPQLAPNNGYQVANYIHPATGSISFNQRYRKPKPRYPPINHISAASSFNFRNPFGQSVGRYLAKPILPIGSAHPEMYANSNLHFTSLNPLFMPNPMRNSHRIPFDQMSASVVRHQFFPRPLIPANMHLSGFPDELLAQASFPRITRSRSDDLNGTEELLNSDLLSEGERMLKYLNDKSTEAFLKQIISEVQAQELIGGVLGASDIKQPVLNMPQIPNKLKLNYGGQVPFFPIQHHQYLRSGPQNQNVGKYGHFMKKLAALSNSLIYQSLGLKQPTTFQGGNKVTHLSTGSVLPEEASPRTTKTDRIGTTLPQTEFSKRVLKPENKDANPPIIVYKGAKPPVETYGSKEDIEDTKEEESSVLKATNRAAEDILDTDPEKVLDYVDIMYSLLPDFIKHSIGQLSDGQSGDGWLPESLVSGTKSNPEVANLPTSSTSAVENTKSNVESQSSAFRDDLEDLAKLLHKEEKSDLIPFR
ncbi:hypothetical protein JTE90_009640 [Oedothorax gibbosus]|uniref:Uncharacterized protein n=1 Tax=Oedothorax gibbosus TaxID=931172 RepID=A0AAV6VCQ9_9ARAC|nr:hypothetical protein JTE90_009640 [Oedothorax gibbosus]